MQKLTLGKIILVFFGLVIVAAVGAALIVLVKRNYEAGQLLREFGEQIEQGKQLDPKRSLEPFSLINQNGDPVTLDDMKGKVWLANFIFTECPGQCILLANQFKDFQEKVKDKEYLRLVSVSVDPETDTPEKLTAYGNHYQASDQWIFLTGERDKVYDLIQKGFALSAAPNPDPVAVAQGEIIAHTTKVALVDPNGIVRKYYDGLTPDDHQQVLADIERLWKEHAP